MKTDHEYTWGELAFLALCLWIVFATIAAITVTESVL